MSVIEIIFGAIILIFAVFLVVAVLMQHGKTHHLSGTIAGGAENLLGKKMGDKVDKVLSKVTSVVSIVFVVAVIVLYVLQS